MYQVWICLFLYGVVMSIFWWSLTHYQFKIDLYTATGTFNLFALTVSPFVLKKLGWDIIEKASQIKPKEKTR